MEVLHCSRWLSLSRDCWTLCSSKDRPLRLRIGVCCGGHILWLGPNDIVRLSVSTKRPLLGHRWNLARERNHQNTYLDNFTIKWWHLTTAFQILSPRFQRQNIHNMTTKLQLWKTSLKTIATGLPWSWTLLGTGSVIRAACETRHHKDYKVQCSSIPFRELHYM